MARRYRGGSQARTHDVFNDLLPEELIRPDLWENENISTKLLKSEYTRLRDIAQKRLRRMEGKAEAKETASYFAHGIPTIKELQKDAALEKDPEAALRRLLSYNLGREARFLSARRGSLSGVRAVNKELSAKLKEVSGGRIKVGANDMQNFGRFMNAMKKAYHVKGRRAGGDRVYASDQFANMWQNLQEKGAVTEKDFRAELALVLADIEEKEGVRLGKANKVKASSVLIGKKLKQKRRKKKNARSGKKRN